MADQKTSLLINRQVPEFIREEYPLFITFLEAYYEYLETKQGTQINDLVKQSKDLRYISDVDASIDEFEESFFNSYASMVPKDVALDKATLIKNVLPLYLSKGSEKSFKLLYRFLYADELEVRYPKNDVLRASDGKWEIENSIKVSTNIYSTYTGDGTTKEFKLLEQTTDVSVYINDVLQTSGYFIRKESKKVLFNTAPTNNSTIKVLYANLDKDILANRKITGVNSNSTAIVEKVTTRIVNNEPVDELFINSKTLVGEFTIGEQLTTDILDSDGVLINVLLKTISSVATITLVDTGASYNVGDPVIIDSSSAEKAASAVISKVFKGTINKVTIVDGGAGFNVASRIAAVGYEPSELNFAINGTNGVKTTGANTTNTFTIFSDIISDVDPANTVLSASDWHFTGNVTTTGNTYLKTPVDKAFSNVSYTGIGEIANVVILAANAVISIVPTLNAEPAVLSLAGTTANTTTPSDIYIDTFGSLGKLVITNPGAGYAVGEELVFHDKPMSFGLGAAAEIREVSFPEGYIQKVEFVPSKITGTANTGSASNVMVQGNGTAFTTELMVGDKIWINGETRTVSVIASDTSLNVNTAFTNTFQTEKFIRKPGLNLLGGQGYKNDRLPTITINTVGGVGGEVTVTTILGDGENLVASGTKRPGEIEEIVITDVGGGFTSIPTIRLDGYGDGTATAYANLNPTYETFPGRWTTSDSILSTLDRKLQGRDYYVNYSYLLSSATEFAKYKKVFNELLHPAGFKAYAELVHLDEVDSTSKGFVANTTEVISGTVNVNSSIHVIGTGTKFNVANTLGIISIGASIAVNSEIRIINNILSNTHLTVSSAFTVTSNDETLVVTS